MLHFHHIKNLIHPILVIGKRLQHFSISFVILVPKCTLFNPDLVSTTCHRKYTSQYEYHYDDIRMDAIASQITSLASVYSDV